MRKIKLMAATSAVALLAAGSAYAADPVEREGMSLVVYGQVNYAFGYIDGDSGGGGFFVTNHAGSTTRFGLKATGQINDDLQLGAKIETSWHDSSITNITPGNQAGSALGSLLELRHAYWWVKSATMGSLRVGRTDTATNGTGEIDLSGTGVADLNFTGWATGRGGATGTNTVNFDGNSRDETIRYDTPSIAGFTLAGSVNGDGDWGVAARYARSFGDFKIALGVGYDEFSSLNTVDDQITASGGIKHASGLSLTAAYGDRDGFTAADAESWNIKPGYSASLNEYGPTHFAIAYGETDVAGTSGTAETYGAFIVQDISHLGANFYLGYRAHESAQGNDQDIIFAGARVKF